MPQKSLIQILNEALEDFENAKVSSIDLDSFRSFLSDKREEALESAFQHVMAMSDYREMPYQYYKDEAKERLIWTLYKLDRLNKIEEIDDVNHRAYYFGRMLYYGNILSLVKQGKFDEAFEMVKDDYCTLAMKVYLEIVNGYLEKKEFCKARDVADEMKGYRDDHPTPQLRAYLRIADAELEARLIEEPKELLKLVARLANGLRYFGGKYNEPEINSEIAVILSKNRFEKEADKTIEFVLSEIDKVEEPDNKYDKSNKDWPLHLLARTLARMGRFDQAIKIAKREELNKLLRADTYIKIGSICSELKKDDEAKIAFDLALKEVEGYGPSYGSYGGSESIYIPLTLEQIKAGFHQDAKKTCKLASEAIDGIRDNNEKDYHYPDVSIAEAQLGRFGDAMQTFEKISGSGHQVEALLGIVSAQVKTKRFDEAKENLELSFESTKREHRFYRDESYIKIVDLCSDLLESTK